MNTREDNSDKIYLDKTTFLDVDILTMLFDAKRGIQAPFLHRALNKYKELKTSSDAARLEVGLLKYILRNMEFHLLTQKLFPTERGLPIILKRR